MSEGIARADKAVIDEAYYQATLTKPLHELYGLAEPHLPKSGVVVDLGCGVGNATLFFLRKGFRVHAVDISPRAIEILQERAGGDPNLVAEVSDMADYAFPACDIVSAGFSLFFLDPDGLAKTWPRIVEALNPGGLFIGQFLGRNDEWRLNGHAMVDGPMLDAMLRDFERLHFEEVEREGETSKGAPKHWHVFHVVARKH